MKVSRIILIDKQMDSVRNAAISMPSSCIHYLSRSNKSVSEDVNQAKYEE